SRHIRHYTQRAEADEKGEGLPTLEIEHKNFLSAIAYAVQEQQTSALQRLTWSLGRPFGGPLSLSGHWSELVNLLEQSILLSEAQDDMEIAAAFRADLATVQ